MGRASCDRHGDGLYRYDGNGVTHFGRAEGVPSDLVELVLAAPTERLGAVAQGDCKTGP